MQWQKAQLKDDLRLPHFLRGKEVWVKIGPPKKTVGISWDNKLHSHIGYEVNIEAPVGRPYSSVSKELVLDLLPEFAEDVEFIPRSVWSQVSSPAK